MLGLVFALLRRAEVPVLSRVVRLFVEFVRSTPLLVQVFFLYYSDQPARRAEALRLS